VTTKPIAIYPNSGETYDGDRKEWVVSSFHLVVLLHFMLFLNDWWSSLSLKFNKDHQLSKIKAVQSRLYKILTNMCWKI
jgi:uncharacterized membrane protein YwzB